MIINGIWVWGILRRGFKKRTIYCWKELVLGRNWWKKKSNFGFRHNLATICRHCHDHDSGHLRNAIHSLSRLMDLLKVMFRTLSNLCYSKEILHIWPLFVCKEKRNKSVHEKRKKNRSWEIDFEGLRKNNDFEVVIWVIFFSLLQMNVYGKERKCE